MSLLKIARTPAITVLPDSSVEDVVAMMIREGVGAVVVVAGGYFPAFLAVACGMGAAAVYLKVGLR